MQVMRIVASSAQDHRRWRHSLRHALPHLASRLLSSPRPQLMGSPYGLTDEAHKAFVSCA
jgi:hypothetical protein